MPAIPAPEKSAGDSRVRWALEWLPELIFVYVSSVVAICAGGRWLDPVGDPGFSWSLAYRLAEGDVLYRDVYLAYGPLSPYLLAAIGKLFKFSAGWMILSNWIPAIGAGVLLLRCGRPFLTTLERTATAGVILAFSLWVPGAGRLVLPYCPEVVHALFLSLGALLIMRSPRLSDRTRCWLAGLLAGLALCAKQEIGLAVLIALFSSLLLRRKEAFSRGARIAMAFGAIAALGGLLAVSSASLDTLRERNHLWPFAVVPPAAWNYLFRIAAGMVEVDPHGLRQATWALLIQLGLLACFGMLAARERKLSHWIRIIVLAAALFCWWIVEGFHWTGRMPVALSSAVAFLVAALAILQSDPEKREHLVALGMFAGLASLRAVFSFKVAGHFDGPAHFATSLTWVLFLCVFAPAILASTPRATRFTRRLTAVLLLVAAWYGTLGGAESLRFPSKEPLESARGTVFLDHWNAVFYGLLSRELKPGERVLVLPEINSVDVIFGLRNVSPVLFHVPGWLDSSVEKDLIRRLETKPPDAVVVFNRYLPEYRVAQFGKGYGELLSQWIYRNYQPVVTARSGSLLRPRNYH